MAKSILIVKLSSLGDVVHTLPAAQALRRRFPRAHMAWAVERAHAGVLRGQPFLDELIEWDRGTTRNLVDFVRRLRRHRWSLAVDFQGLFRSAAIMRLANADVRLGFAPGREASHWFYNARVPAPQGVLHAVEKSLRLVEGLGATVEGLPLVRGYLNPRATPAARAVATFAPSGQALFPLPIGDADRRAVDAWLAEQGFQAGRQRLVVLNPHCRKEANIWPAERYAALAKKLLEFDGVRVAVTGGPVAKELCDAIAGSAEGAMAGRVWRADGRFSLLGSTELIRRAAVFVTGDTGPMHLAAAVDTKIVALFGPADPEKTGPYAADAVVLNKRLPCGPCFARHCPLGHDPPKCMTDITVDEVAIAVARRLSETTGNAPWRRSA
jgi:ADP-heptose:LPS heptosyltransferase